MNRFLSNTPKMLLLITTLCLSFSCSKDADLLSDYVIADKGDLESIALLVDDTYFINNSQSSMLLDVLNNDSFSADTQVTIVATSEPRNGAVTINENNTLTYTPNTSTPEATQTPEEDSFEYTTEVITEPGNAFREQATVTVTPKDMGELLAFPRAEGFGKYTTGGRGGSVYHVTNLNDSGSGSLRYGVETLKVARTIVFNVSGYINLNQPIIIRQGNGNITIAGQTSPEGITLTHSGIWVSESNVIIRYLKIRPGEDAYNPGSLPATDPNYEPDDGISIKGFNGYDLEDIYLDHLTVSWAHDGLIDITSFPNNATTYTRNITVSDCFFYENVDKQYGMLINHSYDITLMRNIMAFTKDRNIAISSGEGEGIEMINNLFYGTERSTWYREGNVNDFIGNVFITGNATRQYETFKMELSTKGNDITLSSIYQEDNLDDRVNADNSFNTRAAPYIKGTANYNNETPIISSSSVESSLVGSSGANLFYDASDNRVFNHITNRTGNLITTEAAIGGYPSINSKTRDDNYDTDKDGMADSWEISIFGDLSKTSNGDANDDGYTNLEEFLYWLTVKN